LIDLYKSKFGEYLRFIRRQDVKGFVHHKPLWLIRPLALEQVRKYAETMEYETARFYGRAAQATQDASIRELLGELAEAEDEHETLAHRLGETILTDSTRAKEGETARRMFVLQYVQPGLAGLMDGSVSTLAPVFAAAFATHNTWQTFLVGIAASIGAGISMAFAEALSDDGSLTGRGAPMLRGAVCGAMTAAGGLGHTLPKRLTHYRPFSTTLPRAAWTFSRFAAWRGLYLHVACFPGFPIGTISVYWIVNSAEGVFLTGSIRRLRIIKAVSLSCCGII
jgi:rubrerythrin